MSEVTEKTTKNLSQDSRFSGRDLNPGPPEYKAGMLTTRRSMAAVGTINGKNSKTEDLHFRKYLDLYLLFVNLFILCDSNTVLRHLSENKH
jgi:hypothetical protein